LSILTRDSIAKPGELRTRREILEVFWRKGVNGNDLVRENTALIDAHLQQNFADCPEAAGMSLVALGGYGRGELFPFSDIDILLIHKRAGDRELASAAEAMFYPLWDAGLDVGHSVRTVADCLADADEDFFFQVALLDARYLAGSKTLFEELKSSYRQKFIEGRRREFLVEMIHHRAERHRRFGEYVYQLEPNIKEGRGGLRDMQALIWTARFVFGLNDLEAVYDAGLLSTEEFNDFRAASDYLARIRNRLHYISKRKNDRLYFEHQEEIAKAFKYKKKHGILDVEQFMRDVYRHMQVIAIAADLFFEHADEVINRPAVSGEGGAGDEAVGSEGLVLRSGRIRFTAPDVLEKSCALFMEIFWVAVSLGRPIHYSARKQLSANLAAIDDEFRASKKMASLFLKILQHENCLAVLEIMLESGFLAEYIPEFAPQKSLAQHDIYHIYTVDHHQVQTVAALHEVIKEKREAFAGAGSPRVMFLAALIHDIGKGSGRDHAEFGADIARDIGRRMGLKRGECEDLSFLVRKHLFLADTAMHRDIDDGELLKRCAEVVGNHERLAMLYLLSIADAKATGPNLWNKWKDALLLDLYLKIGLQLEKSESRSSDLQQGIAFICDKVTEILGANPAVEVTNLPDDYLLNFTPEEIAFHIETRENILVDDAASLVLPKEKENYCSLLIMAHDTYGLLSKICGVIALHNLKVLSAQIFTWPDGTVVDMLGVRLPGDAAGRHLDWQVFGEDLHRAINFRLGLEHRLNRKTLSGKRTVVNGPTQQGVKVVVDNDSSRQYTIVEVRSQDRLGLLYVITRTLGYFHINIYRAKIDSRSGQVVDVFYVLDHRKKKLTDVVFIEEVRQSLLYAASA